VIAQPGMCCDIDAVEQHACFGRIEQPAFARRSRHAEARAPSRPG
jgi:hypothetical protein